MRFAAPAVRLTGFDISEVMLDRARNRAKDLGRDVDLRLGDAIDTVERKVAGFVELVAVHTR